MQTKICTCCKQDKSIYEFHNNKGGKYGVMSNCKVCLLHKQKVYRKNNLDKRRECNKNWRRNNPKKARELDRKYRENNIEKVRKSSRKRRAIKLSTGIGDIPSDTEILRTQGGRCANCKRLESRIPRHTKGHKWTLDHIIPLRPKEGQQAGTHTVDNVQVLCWECNHIKSNKSPKQWAYENGRLL